MTSTDAVGAPGADPWPAFFATPWSWQAHAAIWAIGMLAVNSVLPVIHLGGPVSALAAVGAAATAYLLGPSQRDVSLADAARFALVDSIFLGLAAGLLFPLLLLPLRRAGLSSGSDPLPITLSFLVAAFVAQFYALLWGAAALRRQRGPWRHAPLGVACLAGIALAWSAWQPTASHLAYLGNVERGLSAYERETGKPAEGVKSEIALSLHGFYGRPEDLIVDDQGRLVIVGEFSFYAGHEVRRAVRINPDGSVDTSLRYAGPDSVTPARLRQLEGGAMLIDVPQQPSEFSSPLVLRTLRSDGRLDDGPAVDVGTWSASVDRRWLAPFDLQPDGRILVGRYGPMEDAPQPACVRRFLADGSPDLAFDTAVGDALDSRMAQPARQCAVTDVRALPGGKILVRLSRRDEQGAWREALLRRLHSDGRLDEGFRPDLTGVRDLAVGRNGELIATTSAGAATPPVASLWKLRDDGSPDLSFGVPPGFFAHVDALAIQADGKVLVGGRRPGKATELGLFRLLPDGRPDPEFGRNGRVAVNGFIRRVVAGSEGHIALLGDFMDIGDEPGRLPRYQVARLRPDGTPDPGFNPR